LTACAVMHTARQHFCHQQYRQHLLRASCTCECHFSRTRSNVPSLLTSSSLPELQPALLVILKQVVESTCMPVFAAFPCTFNSMCRRGVCQCRFPHRYCLEAVPAADLLLLARCISSASSSANSSVYAAVLATVVRVRPPRAVLLCRPQVKTPLTIDCKFVWDGTADVIGCLQHVL
jgi:hypothetical protein